MKRLISLLLTAVLIFSLTTTAFSADDTGCGCGHVPVIYITGFAQTDLVANPGTDEQYSVFFPETDAIVSFIAGLIFPVVAFAVTRNSAAFTESLGSAVNSLFADVACDKDGNPLNENVDIKRRDLPSQYHSAYTRSVFRYDWREDVFDIAEELNVFIEETKRLTGHSKVALKAESMGGAVAMTYLYLYGSESVDTLVMQSSAYNGISLVGDMFRGDMDIKPTSVLNYVGNFIEGNSNSTKFYRFLLNTLGAPVIVFLSVFLDRYFENNSDLLFDVSLKKTLGYIPGVWTFVPNEDYESAKDYMLDETENAVLISKIDNYQNNVAARTGELLDEAIENGMKLAIVSNYGKGAVPVITEDGYQSDFLIDTSHTSFGAVCAPFGECFDDDYVQAVDDGHNHISPDRQIDASACRYPEYTWFVKDMMHTWYTAAYERFVYDLIYLPVQPTVDTYEQYPQFLLNNNDTRTLDVLTAENSETRKTDFSLAEFIKSTAAK